VNLDYPGSTADVSFGYDGGGNRIRMADPTGTTTYTYDLLDQLTRVARGADTFS